LANRLRIGRLDPTPYQPVAATRPDAAVHRQLDALIRRYLPPVTASLLAQPMPAADGRHIEWYSDLAGQPLALSSLPKDARDRIRILLNDRLASILELAERLVRADSANKAVADVLRQAVSFPGEETVYVVGDQPVIAFWGHRPNVPPEPPLPPAPPPPPEPAAAAPAPAIAAVATEKRSRWRRWLLWLLLALLLALLAAWLLRSYDLHWPPWGPDVAPLVKQAKDEEEALKRRLDALKAELERAIAECRRKAEEARRRAEEEKRQEEIRRKIETLACVTDRGAVPPLDIYFLQDLTGSFDDDLPNMFRLVADLVARVGRGEFAQDVRFGLGSFMDKPHPEFGTPYTYVYKNHLNLTADGADLIAAVRSLQVEKGGDGPEAQYEALIEMVANARSIGFRDGARRFVVVLTDAESHEAGDWPPGRPRGAPRPASGKGGVGPMDEDYPSPQQVMAALRSIDVTPIFLVSGPSIGAYQRFVDAHGRGVSLALSADSANVLEALFAALRKACKE
jgi:hypothetical protein